jgi:hypothetical protein
MTTNPFEYRGFYIQESNKTKSCGSLNIISHITCDDPSYGIHTDITMEGCTATGPMNLMEIQKYLFDETLKLVVNIQLAQSCDQYGIALNENKKGSIPDNCGITFKEFSTTNITKIKNGLIAGKSRYIPLIQSGQNPFNNFTYTDNYIASKMSVNDKKPLCQRYADIGGMLADFSTILSKIDTSSHIQFTDQFQQILQMYHENNLKRATLEERLDKVIQNAKYSDSKEWLDSTIYTSVLWTVLATVTLVYIFKKM